MVIDDLFGVVHTAVTDFYGVAVKYFAEAVILREMFVDCIYIYIYIYIAMERENKKKQQQNLPKKVTYTKSMPSFLKERD